MKNNREFTKDAVDSVAATRKGLIAPLIETAAINIFQTIESKIRESLKVSHRTIQSFNTKEIVVIEDFHKTPDIYIHLLKVPNYKNQLL